MRERDKLILNDLRRFRCLSRDDIAALHFRHAVNPSTATNSVMKRLVRDGYVEVKTDIRPFVYFPASSPIKTDSQKIRHFLEIARFYREVKRFAPVIRFDVEPKFSKGMPEPDAFLIWSKYAIFTEIQRNVYNQRQIDEKIQRYERFYASEEWRNDYAVFPLIWILTDVKYQIDSRLTIVQTATVEELAREIGFIKKVKIISV